jgi:hypothetical protein
MKQLIKRWLGMERNIPPTQKKHVTVRNTVHPDIRLSKDEWMRRFNVSMLHGKTAVYFD